jgi:hypothetical protein
MRVGTLLEAQSSTCRWLDGPRVAFAQLWPRPHRAAPGSWLIPAKHQSIFATGIIRLASLFNRSDRHEEDQTGRNEQKKKKASK